MRERSSKNAQFRKKIITIKLAPREGVKRKTVTIKQKHDEPVRIVTACDTLIGTRDYQQDALYVTDSVSAQLGEEVKAFGILCDGMGGMQSGEEASNLAVAEMRKELETLQFERNVADFINETVRRLDAMIVKKYGAGVAGTTMVTAVIFGNRLYWGSVGDSRIYLIRRNEIAQVTRDHNYYLYLKEDVEKQKITQEEADTHPMREALVSYIGSGTTELIDTNAEPFALTDGDIVLLCSDGLTRSLTDEEIRAHIYSRRDNLKEASGSLTQYAIDIDMRPKDNTSVILIQYFEEIKER